MQSPNKTKVLVIGATGTIGVFIVKHLLTKSNIQVNAIIRDPSKAPDLVKQIESAGGKVHIADLSKPETLVGVTKGIHTVVSGVSKRNGCDQVATQLNVLKDAVSNGVKRYVSASYGYEWSQVPPGELQMLDEWNYVIKEIEKTGIKHIRIDTGCFIESFFLFCKDFSIWGDPNTKYTLMTYEDTAKYIAEIVSHPDVSGDFKFIANDLSPNEVAEIYNKVRGTNLKPKVVGSIEDLKAKIKDHQFKSEHLPAFIYGLLRVISDGRGRITKSDASKFPGVKPATFEQTLKENPNLVF